LLVHLLIGKNVKKWRLLQLDAQGLLQRVVKDSFPGGVGEIGEHDGVFFSQCFRPPRIKKATDNHCCYHGGSGRYQPARSTASLSDGATGDISGDRRCGLHGRRSGRARGNW